MVDRTIVAPHIRQGSGSLNGFALVAVLKDHLGSHDVVSVLQEPLRSDDLVGIKTSAAVKPRPPTATSVPGLLGLLHNEWDSVMLEQHALREQLFAMRKELSHSLYTHDAAMRVIARLTKERDESRNALAIAERAGHAAPASGKRTADSDAVSRQLEGT